MLPVVTDVKYERHILLHAILTDLHGLIYMLVRFPLTKSRRRENYICWNISFLLCKVYVLLQLIALFLLLPFMSKEVS